MQYSFSPGEWHDNICDLGETFDYDQASYDKYVTMVHDVRLSMSIILGIICTGLVIAGIALSSHDDKGMGVGLIIFACLLILLIIVPIYTAL
jgi:hypothetical protein